MLTTLHSVKGGSGTTVTAAAIAVLTARRIPTVLIDLSRTTDSAAVLGLPNPGLGSVTAVTPGLTLEIPDDVLPTEGELRAWHADDDRAYVIDVGTITSGRDERWDVASFGHVGSLVLRPCYLALSRAMSAMHTASRVLLIDEPGRALGAADVRDAIGRSVTSLPFDPGIARAVDAGLLGSRVPAALEQALSAVDVGDGWGPRAAR